LIDYLQQRHAALLKAAWVESPFSARKFNTWAPNRRWPFFNRDQQFMICGASFIVSSASALANLHGNMFGNACAASVSAAFMHRQCRGSERQQCDVLPSRV